MTLSHISHTLTELVPRMPTGGVRRFTQLMAVFQELHILENPDTFVALKELRMTTEDAIAIPNLGNFALTDWSRKQLASILGIKWNKWFMSSTKEEQADEINRRLWRNPSKRLLRTSRLAVVPNGTAGILRAMVGPRFSPVDDVTLGQIFIRLLGRTEPELRVLRSDITDRSVTYVIAVGKPFKPGDDKVVGDIWGSLTVRNSGEGFAALSVTLSLTRLLCLNGMVAPIPDAILLRHVHRAIPYQKLYDSFTKKIRDLPGKISQGARVLVDARNRAIEDPEHEFVRVLELGHMSRSLLPELQAAYAFEPEQTMFGISQAVTRASQGRSPEERFELDRAAGTYLLQNISAN